MSIKIKEIVKNKYLFTACGLLLALRKPIEKDEGTEADKQKEETGV